MALTTRSVTCSSTRQLLSGAGTGNSGPQGVSDVGVGLYNNGAGTVYIGSVTVTSGTGFPLAANSSLDLGMLGFGDDVYGICVGADTADVRILELS